MYVYVAYSYQCIKPAATSVCGLMLLVYAALRYCCVGMTWISNTLARSVLGSTWKYASQFPKFGDFVLATRGEYLRSSPTLRAEVYLVLEV